MNENEIMEGLKAIEGKVGTIDIFSKDIEAVKQELAKMKSIGMITPDTQAKARMDEKVKWYKNVLRGMQKSINEGTAGEGGNLIPEEWANTILDFTLNYGYVRPGGATIFPMTTDTLNVQDVAAISCGMVLASGTIGESNITSTNWAFNAKKIAVILRYDNEFLQDISPQKVLFIEQQAAKSFVKYEDYVALAGTGANNAANANITGALNAASYTVTAASGAFSGITVSDISSMIDAITGAEIQNPKFVFDKTIKQYIRALKDGAGNYIWNAGNGQRDVETIWGYPVIWTAANILPNVSQTATGTKFGLFGDLRYIMIGQRMGMEIATSSDAGFTTYQTLVRFTQRYDIKVNGAGFAVLKTANS